MSEVKGNPVPSNIKGGILIVGPWAYGFGIDLAQARDFFRRQGARLSDGYIIFTFDSDSAYEGIDGFGRVYWSGNEPTMKTVKPRNNNR